MNAEIFEMTAQAYLRDLAERLMRVPVMFGVDQGDIDQLIALAQEIERADP